MKELDDYTTQSLIGKNILVTGGTTGIGRATARFLAGFGAKVFITGRHQKPLDETIKDTRKKYPEAIISGIVSDLADEKGVRDVFGALEAEFGAPDILINNAGLPADGITEGSYKEWEYVLDTNLLNYMACAHMAVEKMKKKKSGHIVNIGSMSADVREETGTVYVATKSGIQGFTGALRKEVNPLGIKVTLIEPGAVSSDMQPGGSAAHKKKIEALEMLEAEDIAASIVYCLSQPKRCDVVELKIRPLKQII